MTEKTIHVPDYDGSDRRLNADWHQTKGLSLSIIGLLLVNIVSTVWWAATLTNDVTQIKEAPDLLERVIKMEGKLEAYDTVLTRLLSVIDKLDNTVDRIDREQAKRGPIVYKKNKRN